MSKTARNAFALLMIIGLSSLSAFAADKPRSQDWRPTPNWRVARKSSSSLDIQATGMPSTSSMRGACCWPRTSMRTCRA